MVMVLVMTVMTVMMVMMRNDNEEDSGVCALGMVTTNMKMTTTMQYKPEYLHIVIFENGNEDEDQDED